MNSFLVICVVFSFAILVFAADHFHQSTERYKLFAGWREPGFWRPKWIMERYFYASEDELAMKDRVNFKMKPDRKVTLFNMKTRPKFELFKRKHKSKKTRKLFESGDEEVLSVEEKLKKQLSKRNAAEEEEVDGAWWWQEQGSGAEGLVKIETREGPYDELVRHDVICDFGKMDGYAVKFRRGKIYKYKYTDNGIPIGTYPVGSFTIKCSPHRPLISKEFVAFQ